MKYRKKPVEVEAFQLTGELLDEKGWADEGDIHYRLDHAYINTLEGRMYADAGDYIIKGVQGEFYPCKPDIFEQTYEAVEDICKPEGYREG